MIVYDRIKNFENYGFGMFVHFGLYSVLEKGEWAVEHLGKSELAKLAEKFNPDVDWAANIVSCAKKSGCKYITLTTRHHDGFSLYDTMGLSEFDAPHFLGGRDLVGEFVNACNEQGIVPFFYHTALDWSREDYKSDFLHYLKYLRGSVELLCRNYGKIGGIWFDGLWNKPNEDWQEDELYSLIRHYQPEAIIVNNTGLSKRGDLGHIELDSVTFERGKPQSVNLESSLKYIASEMCQVFGVHWGYSKRDFCYKSLAEIIEELCTCRRFGANYLLNAGPMANGKLRHIDEAMFEALGEWIKIQEDALYLPRPCGINVAGNKKDFLLKQNNVYYLFCHDLGMYGDPNVAINSDGNREWVDTFKIGGRVKSVKWLEDGTDVYFEQTGELISVKPAPFNYGTHLVVRIAKIEIE